MKNKHRFTHYRENVRIYKDHYKPSFNLVRLFKSILGILIYGTGSVAHSYVPVDKKRYR